jgi:hypothetical protein
MTWSPHIVQVGKKAAQRLGLLISLLHRRSGFSISNGVLLYKQLIRPMTDYACPIRRSAACSHLRKLHVIQSKCLRVATGAPWYISNMQIHDDLGVPLFADHIRALTERYDSKLAGVGNPLVQQLSRYLRWPRADPGRLARKLRGQVSRNVEAHNDGQIDTESCLAPIN